MAYGKIKSDALIYDNSGSDVEIAISGIPSASSLAAKASLDTAQTFTKGQRGEVTTLTSPATITINFDDSNNFF